MIKSRIPSKKFNWKFAVYELLLIFIGINLAIWFDNWNESRQLKNLEQETIIELIDGLRKDTADIKLNLDSYQWRLDSYDRMTDYLTNQKPFDDTLRNAFTSMFGYTFFVNNTAPYEVLKSRGFGLITNDSLRLKLLDYYDTQQKVILSIETDQKTHSMEYFKPILLEHIDLNQNFEPFDYDKLVNDQSVIQAIRWALFNDSSILIFYERLNETAIDLLKMMEMEID